MSVETQSESRPPQIPENSITANNFLPKSDSQFFENLLQFRDLYRLRQRYVNLSSEDRISSTTESQQPKLESLEVAPGLIVIPQIKKAGYDVMMEMGRLFRNINSGVGTEAAANELEVNLRTYDLEIVKSRPVLPHLNRFDFKNGLFRMVGSNGEPVVDAISAKERRGAVLQASQAIEHFLLLAENNSFAVLMNPAGWNGFKGEDGQEAEPHLNAEVLIFWKDQKGQLKGLTLVVDLEEEQARKTLVSLGVSSQLLEGKTEHDRLANIVRNPALLSLPEAYANPFMYVLDKMLAQRGNGDFRLRMRQGPSETRSVNEVRRDIERFEDLLQLSQEENELISEPKRFILKAGEKFGGKSVQQELIHKIETVILKLTRVHLQKNSLDFTYVSSIPSAAIPAEIGINKWDEFSTEIAFLQTRAGCPPSVAARILGGSSLGIDSAGGTMPSTVSVTDLKDPDFCIKCGACGKYIWKVVRRGQRCPVCPATREC